MDFDGQFSYSKIISVSSSEKVSLSIYPNPAQHFMTVDVNGTLNAPTEMVLYDALGKAVKTMTLFKGKKNIYFLNG